MDKKVGIIGIGSFVPEKILTNFDLEKMVETSDKWIKERTGISERRIADKDMATSDMATKAAKKALENAKIEPEDIDLIIVATVTPDYFFPSTACLVQKNIGAVNAAAFDISAACSGLIFAMSNAWQYIKTGYYKNALIIGADALSKVTDWEDRNTCVLFGDGAGAFVLGEVEDGGILSTFIGTDGSGADTLTCPANHFSQVDIDKRKGNVAKIHKAWMSGTEVFKFAVKIMPYAFEKAIERAGIEVSQIDWFVSHQANIRIIETAAKRFNISMDKFAVTLQKYGNTSSSSIPIALEEYMNDGKIKKGDTIAMAGFGAGLTWGSAVIKL